MVKNKEALLVIGSPMCAAFSRLQHLNFAKMSEEEVKLVIEYGSKHLEFESGGQWRTSPCNRSSVLLTFPRASGAVMRPVEYAGMADSGGRSRRTLKEATAIGHK